MTCFHILICRCCCWVFFFLAASFQSGKINSPYVFPLVHTLRRGWRIFQRRRRRLQTVTVEEQPVGRQEKLGPEQTDVVSQNEDAALHKGPGPEQATAVRSGVGFSVSGM